MKMWDELNTNDQKILPKNVIKKLLKTKKRNSLMFILLISTYTI